MGEGEVERFARSVERRFDGDARSAGIGDDADGVAQIERTRLLGDVARRKILAEEALEIGALCLGDDLAGPFLLELVDHHAVIAEAAVHESRRLLDQTLDAVDVLDPADQLAGELQRTAMGAGRLELDDDARFEAVDRHVEAPARRQADIEKQRRARRVSRDGEGVPQVVRHLRSEKVAQRAAIDLAFQPEHRRRVAGVPQHDRGAGVAGDERAVRLDAAGDVNRLAVAIGEVDAIPAAHLAALRNASSARPNVADAAATAASVSKGSAASSTAR